MEEKVDDHEKRLGLLASAKGGDSGPDLDSLNKLLEQLKQDMKKEFLTAGDFGEWQKKIEKLEEEK